MPIRENYLYRFLVNILWFARNYLNLVLLWVVLLAFWFPLFIVCTGAALKIHLSAKQAPGTASVPLAVWKLVQLAAVFGCLVFYGPWPGIISTSVVGGVICLHAIMTPYTDAASEFYDTVMRSHADAAESADELARPRTPVMDYRGKEDPEFPGAGGPNAGAMPAGMLPARAALAQSAHERARRHSFTVEQATIGKRTTLTQSLRRRGNTQSGPAAGSVNVGGMSVPVEMTKLSPLLRTPPVASAPPTAAPFSEELDSLEI